MICTSKEATQNTKCKLESKFVGFLNFQKTPEICTGADPRSCWSWKTTKQRKPFVRGSRTFLELIMNYRNEVLDISSVLTDGGSSIIDDSFLRCFTSLPPDNWNWNLYLFPLWLCGVIVRHCFLFPIRLSLLMIGFLIFFILFFSLRAILPVSTVISQQDFISCV